MTRCQKAGIILITVICFSFSFCNQLCGASDLTWDFSSGTDIQGWADCSAAETQVDATFKSGELKGIVTGRKPALVSPLFSIEVTARSYAIIRMAYLGDDIMGSLQLLRDPEMLRISTATRHRKCSFAKEVPAVATSGTVPTNNSHDISRTTDANVDTYFFTDVASGAYIVYDLGSHQLVSSFSLIPLMGHFSPHRCLLQRSLSDSEKGPYSTVVTFTLKYSATNQTEEVLHGFSESSRYWRLYIIDSYGNSVGIQKVSFIGYSEGVTTIPFKLDNTDQYVTYYVPLNLADPPREIMRMRLDFLPAVPNSYSVAVLSEFLIDFIRTVKRPEILRVTGCLDLFYNSSSLDTSEASYFVMPEQVLVNGFLPLRYYCLPLNRSTANTYQYATTYNCPAEGGVNIKISGHNFGGHERVFIGSNECPVISRVDIGGPKGEGREVVSEIQCALPPAASTSTSLLSTVRVQSGVLPKLFDDFEGLQYAKYPQRPSVPLVTNVGTCRMDLVWSAPLDALDAMIVTGYVITWRTNSSSPAEYSMTVGNVTTTSIRGLTPATLYSFAVAAVSEGTAQFNSAGLPVDLYGRRSHTAGALVSAFSPYTHEIATLPYDFNFPFFNAEQTLDLGVSRVPNISAAPSSVGPTGHSGGEGQYGLAVVGSANVENCNATVTCCDEYASGYCSAGSLVSAVDLSRQYGRRLVVDTAPSREVPSSLPFSDGGPPTTSVFRAGGGDSGFSAGGEPPPTAQCGPAMRLTPSASREAGAVWYRREGASFCPSAVRMYANLMKDGTNSL